MTNPNRLRALLIFASLSIVFPDVAEAQTSADAQASAGAQTPPDEPDLVVAPTSLPVTLDGALGEPAWAEAIPLALTAHAPSFGGAPALPGTIRILHDGVAIYLGAEFFASADAPVQGHSLTRDVARGDDLLRLVLDTFDDRATAVGFETTPLGIRVDYEIAEDGASINPDWNGQWDAESRTTPDGWTAEMRIPFSTLGYQSTDGAVRMGLIVARFVAALNELSTHPAVEPTFANAAFRPSISRRVVFTGAETRRARYFTPYVLAGSSRAPVLDAEGSRFLSSADEDVEIGGDAKIGLSNSATLDITLNTDFAQVEADDQVVNLGRFSLFFPEKRQFFQERAGLFTVPMAGLAGFDRFFHSRRIGLSSSGVPLRIWGGTRFVGRFGDWDAGLLSLQTDSEIDEGTENAAVGRLRKRLWNDESVIGAAVTTRLGTTSTRNVSWLAETRVRVGREYIRAQVSHTAVSGEATPGVHGGFAQLAVERPSTLFSQGFAYRGGVRVAGEAFDPGLGFALRRGYVNPFANVRYGFFPGGGGILRSIQPSLTWQRFQRTADGALDSDFAALFVNVSLRSGQTGWAGLSRGREVLADTLRLAEAVFVPPGEQRFVNGQIVLNAAPGGRARIGASLEGGEFFDGHRIAVGVRPTFALNEHVEVGFEYERDHVRFPSRDQTLDADIGRLRWNVALDRRWSAAGLFQYNRAFDALSGNLRVRYHLGEGRDLYLVYNERLNTDLDRTLPTLPRSAGRQVLVKATWRLAN